MKTVLIKEIYNDFFSKILIVFVIVSAAFLVGCNGRADDLHGDSAVKLLERSEINQIKEARKESQSDMDAELLFEGVTVPYDINGKYYLTLPSDYSENDLYSLSAGEGVSIAAYAKVIDNGIDSLMKKGTAIELCLYSDTEYKTVSLVFTTIPVMTINIDGVDENSTSRLSTVDRDCEVFLFVPGENDDCPELISSSAVARARGATSIRLPKTGIKLTFKNNKGDNRKISLLNMRSDDDWLLHPLFTDESKVRDMTCWYLWDKFSASYEYSGGVKAEYIELIYNGRYDGIYLLMERFDHSSLDLEEGDVLFKIFESSVPSASDVRRYIQSGRKSKSIEVEYPEGESSYNPWIGMADYLELLYDIEDSDVFSERADKLINVENHLDYWLFVNLIMGYDNLWKNTYIASINEIIHVFPWDMDITFGLAWNGEEENNFLYRKPSSPLLMYEFRGGSVLIDKYDGATEYLKQRWAELNQTGICDVDEVISYAHSCWNKLQNSGAYKREIKRWPNTNKTDSLDYFDNCVRERFNFLNDYIEGLE